MLTAKMTVCFRVSLLAITLCQILIIAEAQLCTMGFPSTVSQCTSGCNTGGNEAVTRIIPDKSFTCNGTVTGWRAAGMIRANGNRNINAMLGIWRKESATYTRVNRIELGKCDGINLPEQTGNNIYECALPENRRVSVQPGDIVGIEIAINDYYRFQLYFVTNGGPANYVFDGQVPTFTQTQLEARSTVQDQPQISLTVEPITTTQPLTTTQASTSTDLPTIQPPTTTEDSLTATTPQPLTTTRASTSAAVVTIIETESTTRSTTETATNAQTTQPSTTTMADAPTTTVNDPPGTTTRSSNSSATTDAPTIMNNPTTVTIEDSASTSSMGEAVGQQNANSNVGTVAGAVVGGIIAILLTFIVILLLVLVLRRQRTSQKFTLASDRATVTNPVYDGNITLQVPDHESDTEAYSIVHDHAPAEYEITDSPRPPNHGHVSLRTDLKHDHSGTPNPYDMNGYAIPLQTLSTNLVSSASSNEPHYDTGTLYVPTQEQRKSLPADGEIYAAIRKAQYSESGPAPVLFEEDDTYWKPAADTCGLFRQLSSKKFREIVRPQIQIVSHLGAGQFGTVNKGIWQSPMGAMDVAVKQLQPGTSEEDKVKFLQEAAINGQFKHPNIVKLLGVVTIGEPAMIVLELLANGDLHKYLLNQRPLPGEILPSNMPQLLLKFCQQVASGMDHLARKAFVHRDLAARNILVSEDKTCKISDFGMSRDLMDENYYISRGGQVPVKWTAPEAIHFKKYSTGSDVWSFGCVMYEIWSFGQKPFQDYRNVEVIRMIDDGYRLSPPPGLPKELYKIMIQCWHPDRSNRPTFHQLVEMLSRADFELFVWEEEDLRNSDPQVKVIGAPLEMAKDLYHELQRSYLSS